MPPPEDSVTEIPLDGGVDLTNEQAIERIRGILGTSAGSYMTVIRPIVVDGVTVGSSGRKFLHSDFGPVTVVTLYITHPPAGELPIILPTTPEAH